MSGFNLVVLRNNVPQRDVDPELEPRRDFELIRQLVSGRYASADDLADGLARRLAGSNTSMQAAFAVHAMRKEARAVFTTGEDIAFRLLPLLRLSGWKGELFSVIHASHSPKWQLAARLLGTRRVGGWFTVSRQQRDVLTGKAGLPASKVHFLYDSVDATFFDPAKAAGVPPGDYAFACGLENRDYATLAAAARFYGGRIKVQASGYFPQENATDTGLPDNLAINRTRMAWTDLRVQYAAAQFVVVPLNAVPYAAGVTGLLEGMAMGKAVVVTDSPGLADYTGLDSLIRVPAGDAARLADTMESLARDPAACAEMGRANRAWILSHATIEQYAETIAARMLGQLAE
jgi:glycosyltransferase involved in cell wall biosynthesis